MTFGSHLCLIGRSGIAQLPTERRPRSFHSPPIARARGALFLSAQPREVNAAHVVNLALDHHRAVAGEDAAQLWHRHVATMLSEQAGNTEPAAPVTPAAGDVQDGSRASWRRMTGPGRGYKLLSINEGGR